MITSEQLVAAMAAEEKALQELERLERLDKSAPRGLLQLLELTQGARRGLETMKASPWAQGLAGYIAEVEQLDEGTLASPAACLRALLERHDEALARARAEYQLAGEHLASLLRQAAADAQYRADLRGRPQQPQLYIRGAELEEAPGEGLPGGDW